MSDPVRIERNEWLDDYRERRLEDLERRDRSECMARSRIDQWSGC